MDDRRSSATRRSWLACGDRVLIEKSSHSYASSVKSAAHPISGALFEQASLNANHRQTGKTPIFPVHKARRGFKC